MSEPPLPSPVPRDRGLQPERTSLAWLRTGLAATAASLVLARVAVQRATPAIAALSVALVVLALAALFEGSLRSAEKRRTFAVHAGEADADGGTPVRPARLPMVARATVVTTVALAVVGMLLLLTTT